MDEKDMLFAFIKNQLTEMTKTIVANYSDNQSNRKNNPFLCFDDKPLNSIMGLGRSFDSQLGSRLQKIIFYAARLKYGDKSVPNYIYLDGRSKKAVVAYIPTEHILSDELKSNARPFNQYLLNVNPQRFDSMVLKCRVFNYHKNSNCSPRIDVFNIGNHIELGRGLQKIPIDLLIILEENGQIKTFAFEIKAGGNLDTKNSQANYNEVRRLNKLFSFGTNKPNGFFATCYNNNGAGLPNGSIYQMLNDSQKMLGSDFWNFVLPDSISYEDFIELYKQAFLQSNLEKEIQALV